MGLDIRELRIKNHVMYNGERCRVEHLDDRCVGFDDSVKFTFVEPNEIDPIPLTPELVEELGFEKRELEKDGTERLSYSRPLKGIYQDPKCKEFVQECLANPELAKEFLEHNLCSLFHYENEEKKKKWMLICERGSIYVSYLHELENMYYYLTGREL